MRDDMFDWPVDTGMIALVNGDRGPKTDLERTWAKFHQENPAYDFKITNNHTPYYSRFWMEKNPQHEGFFRTKSIRQA